MIHNRLKELREKNGYKSAKEAADAMGVNLSTYTQHENGTRQPGRDMIQKYAAFFHSTADYIVAGKLATMVKPNFGRALPSYLASENNGIPVKGFVRAGIWQEAYKPEREANLPIPADLRYPGRVQFALEVQGESMNKRFHPGEYVVCVAYDGDPRPDEVYVVQRQRGDLFEATLKIARPVSRQRLELWPDSTHPDHQSPLVLLAGQQEDGESIEIIGKGVGAYRRVG